MIRRLPVGLVRSWARLVVRARSAKWWPWRKWIAVFALGVPLGMLLLLTWPRLLAEYYYIQIAARGHNVAATMHLRALDQPAAAPVLVRLLGSRDRLNRLWAAEDLGKHTGAEVVDALIWAARDDPDEMVKNAAIASLGKIGDTRALPFLKELGWMKLSAADTLASFGEGGRDALLEYRRSHSDLGRRAAALRELCGVYSGRQMPFGCDPVVKREVDAALHDRAWEVREAGAECVPRMLGKEGVVVLRSLLEDPDPRVRVMASQGLGSLGDGSGFEAARAVLLDETLPEEIRIKAALAFSTIRRRETCLLLRQVIEDSRSPRSRVRRAAESSLSLLGASRDCSWLWPRGSRGVGR